jgi:hypothetical protein
MRIGMRLRSNPIGGHLTLESSPSISIEKMFIFPTYKNCHTLAIGQPVKTSHASFRAEGGDQASSHPMYSSTYDDLP